MRKRVGARLASLLAVGFWAGVPVAAAEAPAPPLATTSMAFDAGILANLGLEIRAVAESATPQPVQYAGALGFAAIELSQLFLAGPLSNFEHFDVGALHQAGGFVLGLPDGEISLQDFVLRVAGFDWDLVDAAGRRWLILVHPQQFLMPDGGLELRRADVVIAPELAARLGRPDLARGYLGEARIALSAELVSLATRVAPGVVEGALGGECVDDFTGDRDLEILAFNSLSQVAREAGVRVAITASATLENVGVAAIEWNWSISPDAPVGPHPYLVMHFYRIADGRIEQIGRSDLKHAFNAQNNDCPCASGPVIYPGCTDFYGSGTNSNTYHLGPREELTAFTGSWESLGSHFDGIPDDDDFRNHGGSFFHDEFEHRLVLPEPELQTLGASYFQEAWYIVGGDVDLLNSMGHSEVVPTLADSTWTFPLAAGAGFGTGGILDEFVDPVAPPAGWQRLLIDTGEGRLDFAVRTTDLGGGSHHYEYALMNYDFDRQIRVFEVPVPEAASISNPSFGDGDTDAANDWSAVENSFFVRFAAPAGSELDWGRLYSFGFEVDRAPVSGTSRLEILEAGPSSELSAALLAPAEAFETDSLRLDGTAEGGSVELSVEGVFFSVPTSQGQGAAAVIAALAAAINADPTLAARGISASASGERLSSNGPITNVAVLDPGLSRLVPALGPAGLWAAMALLALAGALAIRRRAGRA